MLFDIASIFSTRSISTELLSGEYQAGAFAPSSISNDFSWTDRSGRRATTTPPTTLDCSNPESARQVVAH
jgi:hypothetical protein